MPRQFTPSDRNAVRERAEGQPYTHSVSRCGPGLVVECIKGDKAGRCFDGLTCGQGWYVSQYYPRDGGDRLILMPITEVPG